MNVLIFAPGNQNEGTKHYSTLIEKGLEPKNIIVETGQLLTGELAQTVNKRHIGKVLTVGVPHGTIESLIKKLSGLPKVPSIFRLSSECQPGRVMVKKGFYRNINCPTQLFS